MYDVAATAPGAQPVAGRATAYVLRAETQPWLIRHYFRGGSIARVLHDRYFAVGDRARHELSVSTAARAAGIPTPEVVAGVTYRAGLFSRYDIAFEYLEGARDLAAVLFGGGTPADADVIKATTLINIMMERGLVHADLNLKNVLIASQRAYIIDLDRCRLAARVRRREADRMRDRFIHSLDKWQKRTHIRINEDHRSALEDAFSV